MELKLYQVREGIYLAPGSNRTFMELKCCSVNITNLDVEVLIVPLWN